MFDDFLYRSRPLKTLMQFRWPARRTESPGQCSNS